MNTSQTQGASPKKFNLTSWVSRQLHLPPTEAEIAVTGAVVFILGALLLIALNWNAMIYAILLSVALCGAVTAFFTSLSLLKEDKIRANYSLSIPFDMKRNNLAVLSPNMKVSGDDDLLFLQEIGRFASLKPPPEGKPIRKKDKTKHKDKKVDQTEGGTQFLSSQEIFQYCGELLQYHILKIIYLHQRDIWLSLHLDREDKENGNQPDKEEATAKTDEKEEINNLMLGLPPDEKEVTLTKTFQYQGQQLWEVVSRNRFSRIDQERVFWKEARLLVPDNTRVSLNYVVSSPVPGKEGYNLKLIKAGFLEVCFTFVPIDVTDAYPLSADTDTPSDATPSSDDTVPSSGIDHPESAKTVSGAEVSKEEGLEENVKEDKLDEASIRVFQFSFQMLATFNKLTAGNRQTDELKKWVKWLFAEIKKAMTDKALDITTLSKLE
jgi:hypothetical protein